MLETPIQPRARTKMNLPGLTSATKGKFSPNERPEPALTKAVNGPVAALRANIGENRARRSGTKNQRSAGMI
jgi:hypothetical protein